MVLRKCATEKEHRLQIQETKVPIPGLLLTSCDTLGKLLNFSESQIPHLQNGDNIYLAGVLEEQIRYRLEYLDNAWRLEDTQCMLVFPHHPPSTPIIHPSTWVSGRRLLCKIVVGSMRCEVAARKIRPTLSYMNGVLWSCQPRWSVWSVWSSPGHVILRGTLINWSISRGGRLCHLKSAWTGYITPGGKKQTNLGKESIRTIDR